jgi:hypothetical protein
MFDLDNFIFAIKTDKRALILQSRAGARTDTLIINYNYSDKSDI